MTSDEYRAGFMDGWNAAQGGTRIADVVIPRDYTPPKPKKKKRKASRYNKEYAKQYAKLKKKHPRTSFSALAKKAHTATKRALK